eukprot:TRINITY_DN4866_c0_g1_i3.p1 TRINITY_DN4866_c0_g1~~TRINITY_DN4866_c0_g1_i3.p1  ORF type:complete len:253 (+),score=39.74 TRINITY_DN4866_c0_g1_i3:34-759(+)
MPGGPTLRPRSSLKASAAELIAQIELSLQELDRTSERGDGDAFSAVINAINHDMNLVERAMATSTARSKDTMADRPIPTARYRELERRFQLAISAGRQALVRAQQQKNRQALLGTAAASQPRNQDVVAKLRETREMMAQHVSAGTETATSIAAANSALADIKQTLTGVTSSSSQGAKLSKRLKHEDAINRRFICGGFSVFVSTIAYLLWKHAGITSLVFGTAIAAVVAAYIMLYLTCFAKR